MQFSEIKRVYFIGIGGIGMSALARYFKWRGAEVSGYDRTSTELTDQLLKEGMHIHFTDDVQLLDKQADLVIYTPAVPKSHKELNYFIEAGTQLMKRSEVLGMLSRDQFTIAVGGSHGKTTTSSMIAWILKDSGYDCSAFLGGIATNFHSNFTIGNNDVMVAEADEFDRSFLRLYPNITVITAVDSDHLEIYGTQEELEKTFIEFANKTEVGGTIVLRSNLPIIGKVDGDVKTYSLDDKHADLFVKKYSITLKGSDVELSNGIKYTLTYPGIHNIENSVAAALAAGLLEIDPVLIGRALDAFTGIHRRFEMIFQNAQSIFIDDYAHHPEEIRMFLLSVKEIYKGRKITAVFQPHLFTRTRDLADGFANSLDIADEIILLPIYPAREEPIEGVTSDVILSKMKNPHRAILSKEELIKKIRSENIDVLCTIGAGDIDKLVQPIADILKQKA